MYMILVCSYLKKLYIIISFFYFKANLSKMFFHIFIEYYTTVFCWTYNMVNKITYIMR